MKRFDYNAGKVGGIKIGAVIGMIFSFLVAAGSLSTFLGEYYNAGARGDESAGNMYLITGALFLIVGSVLVWTFYSTSITARCLQKNYIEISETGVCGQWCTNLKDIHSVQFFSLTAQDILRAEIDPGNRPYNFYIHTKTGTLKFSIENPEQAYLEIRKLTEKESIVQ